MANTAEPVYIVKSGVDSDGRPVYDLTINGEIYRGYYMETVLETVRRMGGKANEPTRRD